MKQGPLWRERLLRRYGRRGLLWRDLMSFIWASIGVIGFALTYNLVHTPDGPQHWSTDRLTSWLSLRNQTQDERVALVYVTAATLQALPYNSPVDRGILAKVVTAADQAEAKVIGLDFVFDRPSEPGKDDALSKAISSAHAPVIFGVLDARSAPHSFDRGWQDAFLKRSGYPSLRLNVGHLYFDEQRNPYIISDHVVRAVAPPSKAATYRLAFAEAMAKAGGSAEVLKSSQISWLLPPKDGSETFLTLSAQDVIDHGLLAKPETLRKLLGGRHVIIGGNFDDRDQHFTPLSVSDDQLFPGASIHAQLLAQVLDRRAMYAPDRFAEIVIAAIVAIFGFWIGRKKIANQYHRAAEFIAAVVLILTTVLSFIAHFLFPFTLVFFWGMIGLVAGHYSRWNYA